MGRKDGFSVFVCLASFFWSVRVFVCACMCVCGDTRLLF